MYADNIDALLLLGILSMQMKQYKNADILFTKALTINPNHAGCLSNHGIALQELGHIEKSLASFERAIQNKPDYGDAYYNRGIALQKLGRIDEALTSYQGAVDVNPNFAKAHWNLALCHLLSGSWKNGFQGYEWRHQDRMSPFYKEKKHFLQPLWLGRESIKGKTILLFSEQGLGDTIQFCRYVILVAQLGAKVILEVQPPLVKLLENLEGVHQIFSSGEKLPDFDYQCPLLSLPLVFETEIHSVPPAPKCIVSNSKKVDKWQAILGKKNKLRIGLAWSSTSFFQDDHVRSMTLFELLKALPEEDFEYICLQKNIKEIDKEVFQKNPQIQFFGDQLNDFSDTSDLMGCVDLVISTCTSIPHLSCSMGKETWIMLSYLPDWRWLLNRDDSPWYLSARLYRQEEIGQWSGVLRKIKTDLLKFNKLKSI